MPFIQMVRNPSMISSNYLCFHNPFPKPCSMSQVSFNKPMDW
jgi:hypothetical protein